MNTSEILDRAADLIEQRGHCKGVSVDTDGRLCAWGALRAATDHLVGQEALLDRAGVRLRGHVGSLVAIWNDAEDRTSAEVIAALREAARAEQ